MTIYDYVKMGENDRIKWLESFEITTGLVYFGGKSEVAKKLMNHILNMAVQVQLNADRESIFIDAFTGGGKLALSMPEGWFDKIVMNDLNYGVYSYFKCCKDQPDQLMKMIEELGEIMSEDFFKVCVNCRSNKNMQPVASGAMTYWASKAAFNGMIAPGKASYRLGLEDSKSGIPTRAREKEEIKKITAYSKKQIQDVHDRIWRLGIEIENMDYRELIKKYNGKPYRNNGGLKEIKEYEPYGKLWYFDPPYHPATLAGGKAAPYEDTFSVREAQEMVGILHGNRINEYGEIKHFIKSDYDPKYLYHELQEDLADAQIKLNDAVKKNSSKVDDYKKYVAKLNKMCVKLQQFYNDFDLLEDNRKWPGHTANTENPVFYVIELGEFDKGVVNGNGGRLKGREFIWCRGDYIPGIDG